MPGDTAAQHLGVAAWTDHEGADAKFMWPYMFSQLADEYDRRYGLNDAHLHAIAELNMRNAKANPLAQTRGWSFGPGGFAGDDHDNPVVEGRLRRTDCAQVTDGVAGVLLVSDRFRAERAGGKPRARIAGWGHGTAALPLQAKLDRSQGQPYVFPHVRQVVTDAFRRAEIPGVGALDGIETHDCFSMSEYMAIDHFGITEPGESWKAVENGELERDGAIPVNPSGGLIGVGLPVGATGAAAAPATSAGSSSGRPTCCTGSTPGKTATRSSWTGSSRTARNPPRPDRAVPAAGCGASWPRTPCRPGCTGGG